MSIDEKLTYFVHEDDWAMIEFLPIENKAQIEATMRTDHSQGNLHLDERPVIRCPIAMHGLSISTLEKHFAGYMTRTDDILTGTTTDMRDVPNGFAFYDELIGAVYGTQHDGMVCSLYFDNRVCDCDNDVDLLIKGMHKLGKKFKLMLADWWLDSLVDLNEKGDVQHYIDEQ